MAAGVFSGLLMSVCGWEQKPIGAGIWKLIWDSTVWFYTNTMPLSVATQFESLLEVTIQFFVLPKEIKNGDWQNNKEAESVTVPPCRCSRTSTKKQFMYSRSQREYIRLPVHPFSDIERSKTTTHGLLPGPLVERRNCSWAYLFTSKHSDHPRLLLNGIFDPDGTEIDSIALLPCHKSRDYAL